MPPIKCRLSLIYGWKEISFEEFQDGRHGGYLGYRNEIILALLNLHVAPMPHNKFGINQTKGSGTDVVLR